MILESVRYYVRFASSCIFWSPEIVSVFKGFRHFCFRLTDKFSRPPRCDRFDIPAYNSVRATLLYADLGGVARETRFTNPLRIPSEAASSSLVSGERGYPRRDIPIICDLHKYSILSFYWLAKSVSRIRLAIFGKAEIFLRIIICAERIIYYSSQ